MQNTKNKLLNSSKKTFNSAFSLMEKKNHDYAGTEDPFKNFINASAVGVSVEKGILVRMMDKMSRISNLVNNSPSVKSEKIEDTILDLINYAAILKAYIETK